MCRTDDDAHDVHLLPRDLFYKPPNHRAARRRTTQKKSENTYDFAKFFPSFFLLVVDESRNRSS